MTLSPAGTYLDVAHGAGTTHYLQSLLDQRPGHSRADAPRSSRHRSMPALAVVPSRPHTSLREPDIWIAELRPGPQGLGSSSVTAAGAVAADLALSEPRLNPPPFCWTPDWGSTLRSLETRHIQPMDCHGLAAPPLPAPPQA